MTGIQLRFGKLNPLDFLSISSQSSASFTFLNQNFPLYVISIGLFDLKVISTGLFNPKIQFFPIKEYHNTRTYIGPFIILANGLNDYLVAGLFFTEFIKLITPVGTDSSKKNGFRMVCPLLGLLPIEYCLPWCESIHSWFLLPIYRKWIIRIRKLIER